MATIEQKAKAYDEAIKRVEDIKTGKCETRFMFTEGLFEHIFPALKKSEDERIRENIIATIHLYYGEPLEDEAKEMIAWLEKQGEQKPAEISNICEFSIETWVKIVDYVLTEHNGIGNYLIDPEVKDTAEKLQKRYKFDAASEEWDRVYRKGLDAGVNKGRAEALREQNPAAWTEEDKRMARFVGNAITATDSSTYLKDKGIEVIDAHVWLDSLKDRVLLQPKQEWSEEDEKMYTATIFALAGFMGSEDKLDWLKSLKERVGKFDDGYKVGFSAAKYNQWKPSDEQMKQLGWIAKQNKDNMIGKELMSLYQDLKKLKGK